MDDCQDNNVGVMSLCPAKILPYDAHFSTTITHLLDLNFVIFTERACSSVVVVVVVFEVVDYYK